MKVNEYFECLTTLLIYLPGKLVFLVLFNFSIMLYHLLVTSGCA